jgi:hypothetical protein
MDFGVGNILKRKLQKRYFMKARVRKRGKRLNTAKMV